jgi:hypothetical protein
VSGKAGTCPEPRGFIGSKKEVMQQIADEYIRIKKKAKGEVYREGAGIVRVSVQIADDFYDRIAEMYLKNDRPFFVFVRHWFTRTEPIEGCENERDWTVCVKESAHEVEELRYYIGLDGIIEANRKKHSFSLKEDVQSGLRKTPKNQIPEALGNSKIYRKFLDCAASIARSEEYYDDSCEIFMR